MENRRDEMRVAAAKLGSTMRQQAMSVAAKRKQEYLGARVPKELREKIIQKASALGIPVSILIRNILTEYIESDADNTENTAAYSTGVAKSNADAFSDVIGWERLTLNKEMVCNSCTRELKKGNEVVYGITPGKGHVILCERCKSLDSIG